MKIDLDYLLIRCLNILMYERSNITMQNVLSVRDMRELKNEELMKVNGGLWFVGPIIAGVALVAGACYFAYQKGKDDGFNDTWEQRRATPSPAPTPTPTPRP
jgi:lactobin A/cerein 7B family class IIb bacteriocin